MQTPLIQEQEGYIPLSWLLSDMVKPRHKQTIFPHEDQVFAMVVLADGHLLIGGDFQLIQDSFSQSNILRIKPDGSIDTGFSPSINGPVHSIQLQYDGNIKIGGKFSQVGSIASKGMACLCIDGNVIKTNLLANSDTATN